MLFERVDFETDLDCLAMEQEISSTADGETAINMQINVKKAAPKDALINIELSSEKEKDEFVVLIKSGDVPVCGLLQNATGHPLFNAIIGTLDKFSNLPLQCPLPVVSEEFEFQAIYWHCSMSLSPFLFIPGRVLGQRLYGRSRVDSQFHPRGTLQGEGNPSASLAQPQNDLPKRMAALCAEEVINLRQNYQFPFDVSPSSISCCCWL